MKFNVSIIDIATTGNTASTIAELKESLFLQPRHSCCCDGAIQYLCPPTRAGGQFVDMQSGGLIEQLRIDARDTWTFDIGDGGPAPVIKYCPFCGEELPR